MYNGDNEDEWADGDFLDEAQGIKPENETLDCASVQQDYVILKCCTEDKRKRKYW